MYLEHFGLQRQPFKITPDTSMFYSGNKRGAALDALIYAIASGEGIIKVVGEVGSGKTMLCRMLEIELGNNIEIVYIANPSLSPDNILHVIAFELKLNITSSSSKLEVMQALQNYLLEKHVNNNQVVVFVEEAQSMPIETLEEIRLLSNLETNENKLLQMVLFGQPELDDKLHMPEIRQLKERITHNFYLDPFPAADVYRYLNFRMRVVGYKGPDLFSEKIASNIERKSSGLTRRINILADKALLAAFSDGRHDLKSKHINLAARDSDFGKNINWQTTIKASVSFLIILSSIWVGTLLPALFKTKQLPTTAVSHESKLDNNIFNQSAKTTPHKAIAPVIPLKNIARQDSDLLTQHLNLTQQWLETAEDSNYTIQLILIDSWARNEILSYIDKSNKFLNNQHLYIYEASIRGRKVYSVLYNEYQSRELAVAQLQAFSHWFLQSSPYLRTVKGIKADIRKTRQQLADKGRALN
ncbi:MSHA biogenesis protein MshM [hydrothermal vent metagenome]|uniref:MSHA biogenesis protein MshM n=1 Tax=hydrothermal vent metagenome TaxID=652676 RepID=A0A3B0WZK8_9ZZZZ